MIMETLFSITDDQIATTTDEWYTPPWVFAAAALTFDLDVAAPVDPAFRNCPARAYLTAADDGLTQPWSGTVWMNPPYSNSHPWIDRFIEHPAGLCLVPLMPHVTWRGRLMAAADGIAVVNVAFSHADGRKPGRPIWCSLLAARGTECVAALARVSAADHTAAGSYHVKP